MGKNQESDKSMQQIGFNKASSGIDMMKLQQLKAY